MIKNNEIEIHRIDISNADKWNNFLIEQRCSSPFQSSDMCLLYQNTQNFLSSGKIFYLKDEIIAGYVVYRNSEFSFPLNKFLSRTLCIGGPIINSDYLYYSELIFNNLENEFKINSIYNEVWNTKDTSVYKHFISKYQFNEHLNFLININKSKEEVFKSISESTRKKIKKAEKILTLKSVENEQELTILYNLIKENYKDLKIPLLPIEVFKNLFEKNIGLLLLAILDNNPIAARVVLKFNDVLYDWYAGKDNNFFEIPANEYLVWKSLEYGIENNFKIFNFGGAGKPKEYYGPREFKRKFGGELVNFGRYKKINNYFLNYALEKYLSLKIKNENN